MFLATSYADCLDRSSETGISPVVIAKAHGVKVPKSKNHKKTERALKEMPDQKSKKRLLKSTPRSETEIRELILKNMLVNATTQKERFEILEGTENDSEIQADTLRELLENTTAEEELWRLYDLAPEYSEIEEEIFVRIMDAKIPE